MNLTRRIIQIEKVNVKVNVCNIIIPSYFYTYRVDHYAMLVVGQ